MPSSIFLPNLLKLNKNIIVVVEVVCTATFNYQQKSWAFFANFCIFLPNTIFGYQFIFKENLKIIWRRFSWDFLLHLAIIKTHYPCVMYWNSKYFEAFELRNNGEDIIYDPWCLRRFFTTFIVHKHLRCKGPFTLSVNVNSAMLPTILLWLSCLDFLMNLADFSKIHCNSSECGRVAGEKHEIYATAFSSPLCNPNWSGMTQALGLMLQSSHLRLV